MFMVASVYEDARVLSSASLSTMGCGRGLVPR